MSYVAVEVRLLRLKIQLHRTRFLSELLLADSPMNAVCVVEALLAASVPARLCVRWNLQLNPSLVNPDVESELVALEVLKFQSWLKTGLQLSKLQLQRVPWTHAKSSNLAAAVV